MKKVLGICLLALGMAFVGCSLSENEKENTLIIDPVEGDLFAVVVPENKVLIDIIPQDYVLTQENIVKYEPESGYLWIKKAEKIVDKSYPFPTAYRINFYLNEGLLFEANLNNLLSSLGSVGLTLYYLGEEEGRFLFKLEQVKVQQADGTIEGELTEAQKLGLQVFEQYLKDHGKTDR